MMTTNIQSLTKSKAWKALAAHFDEMRGLHLRELFAQDPTRGERMTLEAADLYLDYSKNRITEETLQLLLQLATESGLRERIDAMFNGQRINATEKRAVLHVALRAPREATFLVEGENVVPQVHAVLDRMADFSDRLRNGTWKGHTGKRIRNVVNIGIGGSDLGPVMAYEALRHYSERTMTFRFVSNVDGIDFVEATRDLDPAETLCTDGCYDLMTDMNNCGTCGKACTGGTTCTNGSCQAQTNGAPPKGTCAHDLCTADVGALTPGCDPTGCVTNVCNADSYCCDTDWDSLCTGEVVDYCPPYMCP